MSSMFFMRVMTSSCCPGTARLPVCRGVEGVCGGCTAGVVGADGAATYDGNRFF